MYTIKHTITTTIFAVTMLTPLTGQESLSTADPQDIKIDESGEIKIFSDLTIPAGEVRTGKLRVIGGDLTVAGTVTGRITVIGGNVKILSTAVVEGAIIALGGTVTKDPEAKVTGEVVEINSGKISLSREKSRALFGDADFEDEQALDNHWDHEEWFSRTTFNRGKAWRSRSFRRRVLGDMKLPDDTIFRYNRAESVALYVPFSPDTYDISGFHVGSYFGYAYGPHKWYGRLSIGQYLFKHRVGLLIEGHSEPRNNDSWRVSPEENLLGALLLHEDWYDWYETEGYGASFVMYPFDWVNLKVSYLNEEQSFMPRTADWSLFGGKKTFRSGYAVTDGKEISLSYQARLGDPVGLFYRRFQISLAGSYVTTLEGSDFDYNKTDVVGELFLPLHRRVGIRAAARTGIIQGDPAGYGLQHKVPIGGIGTVGGFSYKDQVGSHYAVVNLDFTLKKRGHITAVLWQYGNAWDATYGLWGEDFISDVQENGSHSVGLRFGDYDTRFEIYRPLTGGSRDFVFYFRIIDL